MGPITLKESVENVQLNRTFKNGSCILEYCMSDDFTDHGNITQSCHNYSNKRVFPRIKIVQLSNALAQMPPRKGAICIY